ncbi:MAG: HD domain-containing protein [Holophagaceae bacterium]|nr:HD domain-containing protein [Holophagaceae bacterium]
MAPFPPNLLASIESRCAQILYRCVEEVGSSKGALYLKPRDEKDFALVSHYGWPRGTRPPEQIGGKDPLAIMIGRQRRTFVANDSEDFPELRSFAQGAENPRFMVSPLYLMGDWVGVLIQREKGKSLPFDLERDDVPTTAICNDLVVTLKDMRIYNVPEPSADEIPTAQIPRLVLPIVPKPRVKMGTVPLPVIPLGGTGMPGMPDIAALLPAPAAAPASPQAPAALVATAPTVSPASEGDQGVMPWEALRGQNGPPVDATSTLAIRHVRATARRMGAMMPEQRHAFWELATLLAAVSGAEAVAFWMEDAEEVRPLLAWSLRPLSAELQQNVLVHAHAALAGVLNEEIRLSAKADNPEAAPFAGLFLTCATLRLATDGGRGDQILLLKGSDAAFEEASLARAKEACRLFSRFLNESRLHERYHRAFLSVSHRILQSGEGRVPQLKAHSLATAKLATSLAVELGLPTYEVEAVSIAAILHDVGMLLLDPALLAKPTLTADELTKVRTHPVLAGSFLKDLRFPYDVNQIIRHHHERWDGHGYPDGLSFEAIPMGSRIVGLIEAYEVMTTGKGYKQPMALMEVTKEIRANAGSQFDPKVAEAFLGLLERTGG